MAQGQKKRGRLLLLNLLVVAALLTAAEIILRLTEPPPPTTTRYAPILKGPLFKRDGAMMVNNFHSELEPDGAPYHGPPPEGANEDLLAQVRAALSFPVAKPAGRARIFILGSSPVWGFVSHRPNDHTLFALYLKEAIERRYAGADVEIINAAHVGFGGPEVLFSMEEVVKYDPDLIMIYFGGVMPLIEGPSDRDDLQKSPGAYRVLEWLDHFHLFRLLRDLIKGNEAIAQEAPGPFTEEDREPPEIDDRGIPLFNPHSLPVHQPLDFDQGVANEIRNLQRFAEQDYEKLFARVAEIARTHDVPAAFFTVATNMADFPPFWSIHQQPIDRADRERFAELLDRGLQAMEQDDPAAAVVWLERAAALGPTYADAHYHLGLAYRRLGRQAEAQIAFRNAKEWDASNERAMDRPNEKLLEIADRYGFALLDTEAIVRTMPESGGYLGREVFIDHQHLTPAALQALAAATAERLPAFLTHAAWTRK